MFRQEVIFGQSSLIDKKRKEEKYFCSQKDYFILIFLLNYFLLGKVMLSLIVRTERKYICHLIITTIIKLIKEICDVFIVDKQCFL